MLLICAHPLNAANPEDIEFRLHLVKDTRAYHMGESIKLEIVYSSQSEKKYQISSSSSLENVIMHLMPSDGVVDLRLLRFEDGWAGSSIGGLGYLSSQPATRQVDLCAWYRFHRPGHYSLVVTSTEVSRLKSVEEGGGQEQLTLESVPVEFDILPADLAWDAGELSNIEEALKAAEAPGESSRAIGRLAQLDTPASVRKLLQLYLAKSNAAPEWLMSSALRESSRIDIIIPSLKTALSDPTVAIPSTLPGLLATLQTRKQLGTPLKYPDDPAKLQEWTEKSKERSDTYAKNLEEANALLMASIDRRTGRSRATAIYQAWSDAEFQNRTRPLPPEVLSRLRLNVLAVDNDLDREQQVQFVVLAWQTMPHGQLLSLIRKLAKDTGRGATYPNYEIFKLWCEDWPEDCGAAILSDAVESGVKTDKNIILLISEAEHPELDQLLETQLHDPTLLQDSAQSQRVAALLLRAGTRRLAPTADALANQFSRKPGCAGEIQGYLLGYLFRLAPEDAGKRLAAELQDKNGTCGWEVIRSLNGARYSDDLIPIATRALDSPNLVSAQAVALFLGDHGPASAEEALWLRLQKLWDTWRNRSVELQALHQPISSGDSIQEQTAALERALASALAHATNWKLSPARSDDLHANCLTEPCRDIAAGKMFLNL